LIKGDERPTSDGLKDELPTSNVRLSTSNQKQKKSKPKEKMLFLLLGCPDARDENLDQLFCFKQNIL